MSNTSTDLNGKPRPIELSEDRFRVTKPESEEDVIELLRDIRAAQDRLETKYDLLVVELKKQK
jgi:hypothetical protein